MQFRQLGESGLTVSAVGLGCNNFGTRIDADATRAVVDAALDAGITFFDTAASYGESEVFLGEALSGRRDDVVLATKVGSRSDVARIGTHWGAKGSRRYIRKAIESSLTRLRTDHVDLYQLHFPDPHTPIEETLAVFDDLVREGKTRYVGCSNLAAWQLADADWIARTRGRARFVSAQNEYSLLDRSVEAELTPACERFGVGLIPFYPLASGMLTGKYRRGEDAPEGTRLSGGRFRKTLADGTPLRSDPVFDTVEKLESFAAERGMGVLDVAIGGLAARPAVASVIAGATRPEQVRANAAAGDWQPTDADTAALDEILAGAPGAGR
jgi:aryl-alcohol dehydrogenase-like predicted oxidoreductase